MGRQKTPSPSVPSPTAPEGEDKPPKRVRAKDEGTGYGDNLWDRQPGESWQAWNAFRTYRDMGEDRSLDRVADATRRTERQRHTRAIYGRIGQWSRENRWVERADAFEAWIDQQRQEHLAKVKVRDALEWAERKRIIAQHAWVDYLKMREEIDRNVSGKPDARAVQQLAQAREKLIFLAREAGFGVSESVLASPDAIPPDLAADLNALLVVRVERQQAQAEREA